MKTLHARLLPVRMARTISLTLLVFRFLFPSLARAETVGSGWESLGRPGGSFSAITIDPRDSLVLYAGTENHGLFKSTDGGESWKASGHGIKHTRILSLAIDPKNSSIVYAGSVQGRSGAPIRD